MEQCLKQKIKLQTNLKCYLLNLSNRPYRILEQSIKILINKNNYNSNNLTQLFNLQKIMCNYLRGTEILRVEIWLSNWNDINLIMELINFIDTKENCEFEEQLKDLQKQNNTLKDENNTLKDGKNW